jgi:hypothetical protein
MTLASARCSTAFQLEREISVIYRVSYAAYFIES